MEPLESMESLDDLHKALSSREIMKIFAAAGTYPIRDPEGLYSRVRSFIFAMAPEAPVTFTGESQIPSVDFQRWISNVKKKQLSSSQSAAAQSWLYDAAARILKAAKVIAQNRASTSDALQPKRTRKKAEAGLVSADFDQVMQGLYAVVKRQFFNPPTEENLQRFRVQRVKKTRTARKSKTITQPLVS